MYDQARSVQDWHNRPHINQYKIYADTVDEQTGEITNASTYYTTGSMDFYAISRQVRKHTNYKYELQHVLPLFIKHNLN